jgi:hypothetical protein
MMTNDDLYWEMDDIEIPVINEPQSGDLITPTPTEAVKKIVSRNVGNTRRRRFR